MPRQLTRVQALDYFLANTPQQRHAEFFAQGDAERIRNHATEVGETYQLFALAQQEATDTSGFRRVVNGQLVPLTPIAERDLAQDRMRRVREALAADLQALEGSALAALATQRAALPPEPAWSAPAGLSESELALFEQRKARLAPSITAQLQQAAHDPQVREQGAQTFMDTVAQLAAQAARTQNHELAAVLRESVPLFIPADRWQLTTRAADYVERELTTTLDRTLGPLAPPAVADRYQRLDALAKAELAVRDARVAITSQLEPQQMLVRGDGGRGEQWTSFERLATDPVTLMGTQGEVLEFAPPDDKAGITSAYEASGHLLREAS